MDACSGPNAILCNVGKVNRFWFSDVPYVSYFQMFHMFAAIQHGGKPEDAHEWSPFKAGTRCWFKWCFSMVDNVINVDIEVWDGEDEKWWPPSNTSYANVYSRKTTIQYLCACFKTSILSSMNMKTKFVENLETSPFQWDWSNTFLRMKSRKSQPNWSVVFVTSSLQWEATLRDTLTTVTDLRVQILIPICPWSEVPVIFNFFQE